MIQYKSIMLLGILIGSFFVSNNLMQQHSAAPTTPFSEYNWIFYELADITTPDLQGDDVLYWGSSLGPYYNSTETLAKLKSAAFSFPELVTYFEFGKSFEGKPLAGVKITNAAVNGPKYETVVVGAHHAREVITVLDALIFMDRLLIDYYTGDNWATTLLTEAEIYVVPLLNPDGLDFTYRNPWQRKNMQLIDDDHDNFTNDQYEVADVNGDHFIGKFYNSTLGYETLEAIDGADTDTAAGEDLPGGIDLNRNYDYKFAYDNSGSSDDARSDAFRGENAFAAPETAAWKSFAESHHFYTALSLHSGVQAMIAPWGYTGTPPADAAIFDAIRGNATSLTDFPLWEDISGYMVNGEWGDWMYGELDSLAFTIETYGNSQALKYLPYENTYYQAGIWDYFNPAADQIYVTSSSGVQIMADYVIAYPLYSTESIFAALPGKFTTSALTLTTEGENLTVQWQGVVAGSDVFMAIEVENATTLGWSTTTQLSLPRNTTSASISSTVSSEQHYRVYLGSSSRGYSYYSSTTSLSAIEKRGIDISYTMPASSISFTATIPSTSSTSTESSTTIISTNSTQSTSSSTTPTNYSSSTQPDTPKLSSENTVFYPILSTFSALLLLLTRLSRE